jgi:hypothetical protein
MNRSRATQSKYVALYSHWISLIVAIAMSYYFRLPMQQPRESKSKQSRDLFAKQCNEFLQDHANPTVLHNFFNFGDTITTLIQNFFTATAIPRMVFIIIICYCYNKSLTAGIAPTNSLKENLFCTVMCIDICITKAIKYSTLTVITN